MSVSTDKDTVIAEARAPAEVLVDAPRPVQRPVQLSMRQLREQREALQSQILAGRNEAVERQHALGKRTARERLGLLLDEGSFIEIEMYRRHRAADGLKANGTRPHTDGVVAGSGTIEGRQVFVYAQDFAIFGGSLGEAHAAKIHKTMDLALAIGCPLIGLNDGGGARIQEGVVALDAYGGIFRRNVQASGIIPQISVVLGPCAGGAAYSPALCDFTFMVRQIAQMYLTGPDVVAAVTGEQVTHEELGGADVHAERSGVATFVYDDEESCLQDVRYLVTMLPGNNLDPPPAASARGATADERPRLVEIVPHEPNKPYDMLWVVAELVDDGEFLELHEDWAQNVICALARIDGEVVGIIGNQPTVLAGALDSAASQKAARFVRFCDAFGIPLVTLVDVPGFLPGTDQEYHSAWCQVAVRLLRGDGAAHSGYPSQGLWRSVHRDGLAFDRCGPVARVANQRDSGDGRGGRCQRHLPQGTGRYGGLGATAIRVGLRVRGEARASVLRRRARACGRRDRSGGHSIGGRVRAGHATRQKEGAAATQARQCALVRAEYD